MKMPALSVRCPRCQTVFKVDAALAGRQTQCAHCDQAMLVPSNSPPQVASAPPVVSAPPPAPAPVATRIQIVAADAKAKAAPVTPSRRELSPREKAKLAFRANILMLLLGVIVLSMTMLLLLYLTENQTPS